MLLLRSNSNPSTSTSNSSPPQWKRKQTSPFNSSLRLQPRHALESRDFRLWFPGFFQGRGAAQKKGCKQKVWNLKISATGNVQVSKSCRLWLNTEPLPITRRGGPLIQWGLFLWTALLSSRVCSVLTYLRLQFSCVILIRKGQRLLIRRMQKLGARWRSCRESSCSGFGDLPTRDREGLCPFPRALWPCAPCRFRYCMRVGTTCMPDASSSLVWMLFTAQWLSFFDTAQTHSIFSVQWVCFYQRDPTVTLCVIYCMCIYKPLYIHMYVQMYRNIYVHMYRNVYILLYRNVYETNVQNYLTVASKA